jgi:hypothetical protein
MRLGHHCGDDLPNDCPAEVTSCTGYAHSRVRQLGDMLTAGECDDLTLLRGLRAFDVAIRGALELAPDLQL